jgi:arginyl-tRNA synthetase
MPDFSSALTPEAMARQLADEDLWQYALQASKVDAAIEQAVSSGEPSHVARFAFQLAQAFSGFYDKYNVVHEADAEKRTFLLWLTGYFRSQMERTLSVLGIEVPRYM